MSIYRGTLALDLYGHRASLLDGGSTVLMTRDRVIGKVTDAGTEEAFQRYRNMPGVGSGSPISVSGIAKSVDGYGTVLYIS